jgi:hypothetical protein
MSIGMTAASAQQDDVAVAGESDGLHLLLPSFEGAPPQQDLQRIERRKLYFGTRTGEIGARDGIVLTHNPETDEITVSPRLPLPRGEVAGRDRPTQWLRMASSAPDSSAIAKAIEAQLDALGSGAAVKSLAAWQTPRDGDLLILEVVAALPDAQPSDFDGKQTAAIYLFRRIGADWTLSDVLMSRASEDTDAAWKHEVIAVGRDRVAETVYVFVRSHGDEWEAIELFSAGSGGFSSVSRICFGNC